MRFLIDMNLTPAWREALEAEGWPAIHWSNVGDPNATDAALMTWARQEGCIVLTNDLDFGAILAATQAQGPSVVQIRAQRLMPAQLSETLISVLRRYERELQHGALIVVDDALSRVRILPLRRD